MRKSLIISIVTFAALAGGGGVMLQAHMADVDFARRNDQVFVGETGALSAEYQAHVRMVVFNRPNDRRRFVSIYEPAEQELGGETNRRITGTDNRDGRWTSVSVCLGKDVHSIQCFYNLGPDSTDMLSRTLHADATRRLSQAAENANELVPGETH